MSQKGPQLDLNDCAFMSYPYYRITSYGVSGNFLSKNDYSKDLKLLATSHLIYNFLSKLRPLGNMKYPTRVPNKLLCILVFKKSNILQDFTTLAINPVFSDEVTENIQFFRRTIIKMWPILVPQTNPLKVEIFNFLSVNALFFSIKNCKSCSIQPNNNYHLIYLSLLLLQNWFVYDKIPTNLAGEKHLIEFENNFLPLAENYNSYCKVNIFRVFNYTFRNCRRNISIYQLTPIIDHLFNNATAHTSVLLLII